MLPKQIIELADGFVQIYDAENPAVIKFRKIRNSILSSYVARFGGWQDGAVIEIGKQIHTYLEQKGLFIWGKLQEILNATEIKSYPNLNNDLQSYLATNLNSSIEAAKRYIEEIRVEANVPTGYIVEILQSFHNLLVHLNAEVDLFCLKYAAKESANTDKTKYVNIGNFTGVLGDIVGSEVNLQVASNQSKDEKNNNAWSVEKWCAVVGTVIAMLGFLWAIYIWYKPTPDSVQQDRKISSDNMALSNAITAISRIPHEKKRFITPSFTVAAVHDDQDVSICGPTPENGWGIVPSSVAFVIESVKGEQGKDWSFSLTTTKPTVCYHIICRHHMRGMSGAISFHYEYDIQKELPPL